MGILFNNVIHFLRRKPRSKDKDAGHHDSHRSGSRRETEEEKRARKERERRAKKAQEEAIKDIEQLKEKLLSMQSNEGSEKPIEDMQKLRQILENLITL